MAENWFDRQSRNVRRDVNTLPTWMISQEGKASRSRMNRGERVGALIDFFLASFQENPKENTTFDKDVLEVLNTLKNKYR